MKQILLRTWYDFSSCRFTLSIISCNKPAGKLPNSFGVPTNPSPPHPFRVPSQSYNYINKYKSLTKLNKSVGWKPIKSIKPVKIDKMATCFFQISNKWSNMIYNKTEHFNIYDLKGVCKLTCVNCKMFYIERTNRSFKAGFKEHAYFRYIEGHSNFDNRLIEDGVKL